MKALVSPTSLLHELFGLDLNIDIDDFTHLSLS